MLWAVALLLAFLLLFPLLPFLVVLVALLFLVLLLVRLQGRGVCQGRVLGRDPVLVFALLVFVLVLLGRSRVQVAILFGQLQREETG